MERKPMLPAVEKFVADMRVTCEKVAGDEKWERCQE
ncbi:MAG: hypothetical protein ACI9MU_004001, partial [Alphaproteobacteria bacterium]